MCSCFNWLCVVFFYILYMERAYIARIWFPKIHALTRIKSGNLSWIRDRYTDHKLSRLNFNIRKINYKYLKHFGYGYKIDKLIRNLIYNNMKRIIRLMYSGSTTYLLCMCVYIYVCLYTCEKWKWELISVG